MALLKMIALLVLVAHADMYSVDTITTTSEKLKIEYANGSYNWNYCEKRQGETTLLDVVSVVPISTQEYSIC